VDGRGVGSGDHMTVRHVHGNEEDVIVTKDGGHLKVSRLVPQIRIQSSSPALPATSESGFALADVDAATEKRMLALYKMFDKTR